MKVLDLQCALGHTFEGWFASEHDFHSQCERALVQCPVCTSAVITKKLSAPRLNLSTRRESSEVESATAMEPAQSLVATPELTAAWLALARHVVANTTDMGDRFAEEARRIHYGEAQERSIRGTTTRKEAMELVEEGIAVVPMPLPDLVKETLQ